MYIYKLSDAYSFKIFIQNAKNIYNLTSYI